MKYYIVEPEVAGGFGEGTIIDYSSGKMLVKELHYKFDGWLGDEILESTPCFIASKKIMQEIKRVSCTGVTFSDVEISMSDDFKSTRPSLILPEFVWLRIDGNPGCSDFAINPDLNLVVSELALEILSRVGMSHAASIKLLTDFSLF